MTTKVKPLYDRVLVERFESQQTTAGGIIIPDTAQEKTMLGRVVATGECRKDGNGPLQVKNGDTILFGKYAGTEIKFDDNDYVILREDEILGVVER